MSENTPAPDGPVRARRRSRATGRRPGPPTKGERNQRKLDAALAEFRQNYPLLVCEAAKDILKPDLKPNERAFALQSFMKLLDNLPPEMRSSLDTPSPEQWRWIVDEMVAELKGDPTRGAVVATEPDTIEPGPEPKFDAVLERTVETPVPDEDKAPLADEEGLSAPARIAAAALSVVDRVRAKILRGQQVTSDDAAALTRDERDLIARETGIVVKDGWACGDTMSPYRDRRRPNVGDF